MKWASHHAQFILIRPLCFRFLLLAVPKKVSFCIWRMCFESTYIPCLYPCLLILKRSPDPCPVQWFILFHRTITQPEHKSICVVSSHVKLRFIRINRYFSTCTFHKTEKSKSFVVYELLMRGGESLFLY